MRRNAYSSENLLRAVSGGGISAATLTYDPLMRLYEDKGNASGAATRFAYDGTDMLAEYDQSNALQKRTVFGDGEDAPLVQLDAAGTRTWLTADERGSIIAQADDSGAVTTSREAPPNNLLSYSHAVVIRFALLETQEMDR